MFISLVKKEQKMSIFNRLFKKKAENPDARGFVKNLEEFLQGIDAIEKQLTAYNKALYEEGSKKFYTLRLPTPDAGGNTSYCFKEGYRIETDSINITLYPDSYKKGKFGVSINHLAPLPAAKTNAFNDILATRGANLQATSTVKEIVKEEYKEFSLTELQLYIKTIIKNDRLDLDKISYDI